MIAKPIVALAEKDLGFLPGDMIEKVRPYMQSIYDNINFLKNTCSNGSKDKLEKLLASDKIVVEPLAYIRGRTYANTILIVDEAQNLSPLEVKTIVTRMGEKSKVIFTGDIYQIDDKYLDSTNNGLTYLIEKAKKFGLYQEILNVFSNNNYTIINKNRYNNIPLDSEDILLHLNYQK